MHETSFAIFDNFLSGVLDSWLVWIVEVWEIENFASA